MAAILAFCSILTILDPQFARAEDKPAETVKASNIIASAGEANLANGNGDVSASGLKWLPTAVCAMRMLTGCDLDRHMRWGYQEFLQGRRARRGSARSMHHQEDSRAEAGQRSG